jgi:hypothetical protein
MEDNKETKIRLVIKNSSQSIDFGNYEAVVNIKTQDGGRVFEGVKYIAEFERYEIREGVYKLRIKISENTCKNKCNE